MHVKFTSDVPIVHTAHIAWYRGAVWVFNTLRHLEDKANLHEILSAEVDQGRMFIHWLRTFSENIEKSQNNCKHFGELFTLKEGAWKGTVRGWLINCVVIYLVTWIITVKMHLYFSLGPLFVSYWYYFVHSATINCWQYAKLNFFYLFIQRKKLYLLTTYTNICANGFLAGLRS